jgi:hypothetical protein
MHLANVIHTGHYANIVTTDDQVFSPEEEASFNVDALVNDSEFEPPSVRTPAIHELIEQPRRATPIIPPGFSIPVQKSPIAHPAPPMSRSASSTITPVVPLVPTKPIRSATPVKSKKEKQPVETAAHQETIPREKTTTLPIAAPATPVKSNKKSSPIKPQLTAEISKLKAEEMPVTVAKGREHPTPEYSLKATPKSKTERKHQVVAVVESAAQKENRLVEASPAPVPFASTKRQHPGKLDIAAATKLPQAGQTSMTDTPKTDSQIRNPRTASLASASSVPASPAATSTGSPVKRTTAPRTLRVVPTPKTEFPPPSSAIPATSVPQVAVVEKLRSRQASIASINQPGTPTSELISDNASVTSTSISRANSPPFIGGKVGSAPVRKKTKSQAKKDRHERARQIQEEQALTLEEQTKSEPEPIQAPIMGRKKKTKKASAVTPKPISPPANSQPPSPRFAKVEDEEEEPPRTATPVSEPVTTTKKGHSAKPSVSSPRLPHDSPQRDTSEMREKRELSAQSIIADLQKTGELLASTLEFFKPLSASLAHAARASQSGSTITPLDLKIHFSEADLDALAKKKPVRLNGDGRLDTRTLITPHGKFFWGLTQELEERALELEKHIEDLKGAARFHPRKQSSYLYSSKEAPRAQSKDVLPAIATALKEAGAALRESGSKSASQAIPILDSTSTLLSSTSLQLPPVQAPEDWPLNGSPPVPAPQAQPQPTPQTPADAGTYLNQFVLPKTDNPSPNTPRTEMAAVGGLPGSGVANIPVNVNKIAKAARAVAEGGALGGDLDGMGVMAADLLGGVVVQGLEALVGAGLGFHSGQDISVDDKGNITLGGAGLDIQGLVDAIGVSGGVAGSNGAAGAGTAGGRRVGRSSVLSMEEAEQAMITAKKDHDALEKKLAAVMKRNKKVVNGGRA